MQPRQRIPFQGGMPNSFFGPTMYGRPPMRRPMGNPPWMGMRAAPRARQGGGLLAKILGRGNGAAGIGGPSGIGRTATGNAGGSLLKSISNPSSIAGFLQNTQKVLNTAQQIGPIVQQYGPLVKNLPAMWRLYKGLKDSPSSEEESNEEIESSEATYESEEKEEQNLLTNSTNKRTTTSKVEIESKRQMGSTKGTSRPKLYI